MTEDIEERTSCNATLRDATAERADVGQTMACETFTVTAVCRPLGDGCVEASYRAPGVAFPLTARADTLEDLELIVAEIVSALAGRPADAVTVEVVLDLDEPRAVRRL